MFPLLIRIKKAKAHFIDKQTTISWVAIQKSMPQRSADDIRQFWNMKIVPFLSQEQLASQWSKEDDLQLLRSIVD